MNCPKCHAAMETVTFDDVTVDRCTGCKGLWFDANEQLHLKSKKGSEAVDSGDVSVGKKMDKITNIQCPRCHGPMIRMVDVDQRHIDYEACTTCYGIFLDAGEFRDLKDYTMSEYLRGMFGAGRKKA